MKVSRTFRQRFSTRCLEREKKELTAQIANERRCLLFHFRSIVFSRHRPQRLSVLNSPHYYLHSRIYNPRLRMLSRGSRPVVVTLERHLRVAPFSWSSTPHSHHPNAPLELDSSWKSLLKDVDIALLRHKRLSESSNNGPSSTLRQLELVPRTDVDSEDILADENEPHESLGRKSPAAAFGSQRIGAVQLPLELQDSITRLIAGQSGAPRFFITSY